MPVIVNDTPIPDECAASGQSCWYTNNGPNGESQCKYCGKGEGDDVEAKKLDGEIRNDVDMAFVYYDDGAPTTAGIRLIRAGLKALIFGDAKSEATMGTDRKVKNLSDALEFYIEADNINDDQDGDSEEAVDGISAG